MKCTQDGFQKFKNFYGFSNSNLQRIFLLFYGGQGKVKTINYHMFGRKNIFRIKPYHIRFTRPKNSAKLK